MIAAVAGLLGGEVPVRALGLPLPGPVAGIALGLNGAVTSLLTPLVVPPLLRLFGGS